MNRITYKLKSGNINRLKSSIEDLEHPSENMLQIEVQAIGLNFADVFAILGLYSATPSGSFIPGLEFSGTVIDKGSEVSSFEIGDRVMGVTRFGAYTSHLNIDHKLCTILPDHWTFEDGAAYLVQVLTAYYGLVELGNIYEGARVLIHSGAGGVGIWANRIAKHFKAETIGTVGSHKKLKTLTDECFDYGLVRNPKTFKNDLIRTLNGKPLHLIMDSIGGQVMKDGYDVMAPMGRLILFGSAHYGERKDRPNYLRLIPKYLSRPRINPQGMIEQNKSIMGFNLIYLFEQVNLMHEILQKLNIMNLGKPLIGHTYSFNNLKEAIRFFQSGQSIGKIVITDIAQDE